MAYMCKTQGNRGGEQPSTTLFSKGGQFLTFNDHYNFSPHSVLQYCLISEKLAKSSKSQKY